MESRLSSRYRVIAVVVLVLIAGFVTTSLTNYQISRQAIRDSIISNELPLSSHTIFAEIQADLLRPIFVSSLMAQDTFLRDWVLDGEQNPEQMRRYLDEIRQRYNAFSSYFISARTLNYYHFTGLSRQVNPEDLADQWFWRVRDMSSPYEVNLDYNREQESALTVYINYRMLDYDGHFLGVTGVGLGLDSVQQLIQRYQQDFRRTIYFVDQQGLIKLHSQQTDMRGLSIKEQPGINAIAPALLKQQHSTFTYEKDGELMLLTSRYLPELKWYLLIELKESEAIAPIRQSLFMNMAIGTLVVLVIATVIASTINGFHLRLEQLASTDKLSGLGNRQYFDQSLAQAFQYYQRNQQPFSLILLDIDHFKRINDQYGHSTGDAVIRQISQRIGDQIRSSDILCRWGGEEFAVLARDCTTEQAVQLAEKIRQNIEATPILDEDSHSEYKAAIQITLSAGVSQTQPKDTSSQLFSRADQALYRAKHRGRNRVESG
ncbi:MAG: diguanylate cyclase [Marinobacterium sp.]|nr:diguanylate cyclase [Marinobacterium sp.]